MLNAINEICKWAEGSKYWERAALENILAGNEFTEESYQQLLTYLLEDNQLEKQTGEHPKLEFLETAIYKSESCKSGVRVAKICNLKGINALVSKQELSFGNALTAVFGENGSGKSGYARVLGCAGFTRGDKQILPNVMEPIDEDVVQTAEVWLSDGKKIDYQVGTLCLELSSYFVFDSTSVQVHLNDENKVSFSPPGLSYLRELAEVTDHIRSLLQSKIESCNQPHNFNQLFNVESEVSELVKDLGPETDMAKLKHLSILTSAEEERIKKLDIEIAELKAEKISEKINLLNEVIKDLQSLIKRLSNITIALDDQHLKGIDALLKVYNECFEASQSHSIDQFKSDRFRHVGQELWRKFIKSAKALAEVEGEDEKPYPIDSDQCLLCRQPLMPDASNLIRALWEFLATEAQEHLGEARKNIEEEKQRVAALDLDFMIDESVFHRHLNERNKALLSKVLKFLSAARKRRDAAVEAMSQYATGTYHALPGNGVDNIDAMVTALEAERDVLARKNNAEQIARLEKEKRNLDHRVVLGQHYTAIEGYVRNKVWAKRASKIGGNTRHITQKHNELFKLLVTDEYVKLFEQSLRDLKRPLRVKLQTRGQKGDTLKRIVLEADPSASPQQVQPSKVLSEGEKRAVALADFLAETALDKTCQGLVLDDPVTSLDAEWKDNIAARLVAECKVRQVIIFTHDLHFLYLLNDYAGKMEVPIYTHWIKRGDIDGKPGYVFNDNSPLTEQSFRKSKRARSFYERALRADAEEQESLLQQGFGALRTSYEAFIIFDLFNEVVQRFNERLSFGRLKEIVWDDAIVKEVIGKCELLSRHIEGHLHSDAFTARKPTPSALLVEIDAFEELKKKHKALKKM